MPRVSFTVFFGSGVIIICHSNSSAAEIRFINEIAQELNKYQSLSICNYLQAMFITH